MDCKSNTLKNILTVVGFIAAIVAIASAVYGALKFFERRKTEEFMDYYFDEDDDFDDELEEAAQNSEVDEDVQDEE